MIHFAVKSAGFTGEPRTMKGQVTPMKKLIVAVLAATLAGYGLPVSAAPAKAKNRKTPLKKAQASTSTAKPATLKATVLDNFDTPDWSPSSYEGTEIAVAPGTGVQGSGMNIKYDLKATNQWVQVSKGFELPGIKDRAVDFQYKGTGASNNLEIKLVDADGSVYGHKLMAATNQAQWKRVRLKESDFTYWWGGDKNLDGVKEVFFAISAGDGGAGEITVDELLLVQLPSSAAAPKPESGLALAASATIDEGGRASDWSAAQGDGANCSLSSGSGMSGRNAVTLKYSIPEGQWASMRKSARVPLTSSDTLLVSLKMEGAPNNLEFKVIDRDDSTFAKVFEGLSGKDGWHKITIPVSELQYMWGGDNKLDMNNIEFVELAVSGSGGQGAVLVDSIKVAKK
jgi:hypothetical protein